ncbi:hypothetical protein LWI28_009830 [Acer negundo]|uniref:DUF4283 domain-containing protein n=1 Tax=Acer negundo TaxID=4023 RepID=A0AAD5NG81_ACENE|nr:hypothetical protein LWI28_009830 [Acer negundo]
MYMKEIACLCGSLSLKEREGPVRSLHIDMKDYGQRKWLIVWLERCFLIDWSIVMSVIKKIWLVLEDFEIEAVGGDIFTFYFNNEEDRKKVLDCGPWSFDRCFIRS